MDRFSFPLNWSKENTVANWTDIVSATSQAWVFHFIFPKFRLGGQNFAKSSLKFRVNQRKFTGIHVKCQSTFVRTKDEIRQTLLSLFLHSTVMDTIVTQSWCFKMAHGMLSSWMLLWRSKWHRLGTDTMTNNIFSWFLMLGTCTGPPTNTQDSQQFN